MSSDSAVVAKILSTIPVEWQGTTFKNKELLGREGFAEKMNQLVSGGVDGITTESLEALGNAEDYLRVASNVSTTLEVFLARAKGSTVEQVFTFASAIMPIVAVLLTTPGTVHLYTGSKPSPFNGDQVKLLSLLGGSLNIHQGEPEANDETVLVLGNSDSPVVDGIITENVLYIVNKDKIKPGSILVIRKRMATPMTTPMALAHLRTLANLPVETKVPSSDSEIAEFYGHLQTLSGTAVNTSALPVVCTAGLPTIASLWTTLVSRGGADILMASTAYGGSSQLTDILTTEAQSLVKHTFDIQGIDTNIINRIKGRLEDLASEKDKRKGITVLFVEVPTNPDMKVPDIIQLVPIIQSYVKETGKQLLMLVDATFAPGSKVMEKFEQQAPEISVMAFISLSKSVSRGITTAGTLVANHTEFATSLIRDVAETAKLLDTTAKQDQITRLVENHKGVEERCLVAYTAAAAIGEALRSAVQKSCSVDMPLAFPTPEQAAKGFSSSTFSFNLPSPENASNEVCAALAQRFVDLLCEHSEFKPCVSFGQDNGLVYATVPATSTQGAIKEEDKAKQAVGGVQLVRLSFAPTVNVSNVSAIITNAVATIYSKD